MTIDPRSLLSRYGLRAKSYYSQNFLVSGQVIQKMASYAKGTVLEVGPGLGTLTEELAKNAENVIAIEKDPNMVRVLTQEHDWDNVEIIYADVLEMEVPRFDVCISSVPYSISSPLLFKLLGLEYEYLVLMLQKEFAEKLYSSENPSRLTMMSQALCDTTPVMKVPPKAFFPRPKVNSMIVRIVPNRKFTVDEAYSTVVTSLMTHKKKIVRNALIDSRESFNKDKEEMRVVAEDVPYRNVRGKDLDIYKMKEITDYIINAIG
ncbi:MAG TPA: 16S rRNA (adenine(1518)-N(6)/adenine(1519)-N(6))-dimethyltransferase RsmA [Candidatus Methanofastidiosa archaeon]|mgnify:CR=1 FL=1|nr:16S rRNA (adenine(1518)-N(6)/adenine(1519)-N(6))-dimethyltransferase RsmA [Candidatus Methanofastidiosa archaeon]HPR41222.1 16S rRNA (adenine(1518)-N(6)/adenine(1519)-N(6))-dimethyltransferase RsmA [Candidatus Methanofastidiosa archaeon]